MITVVIPYFQREPGVLRRALLSIAAQRDCGMPMHVLVVDDASPAPAEDEWAGSSLGPSTSLQLIKQANAGPGAARNRGIAHAPANTRYIAFLDSDDEWSTDHVWRGVTALEQGFDFYFADLLQLNQTVSAFERGGRIDVTVHPALTDAPALHRYVGDMFDQIIRGNVIGTPTVMYRFEKFSRHRFRTDLTRAGEDYLFWMTLARAGARIAFSAQVEATCGRGVNVYAGARWASNEFFARLQNELAYRRATSRLFQVSTSQKQHLERMVESLRQGFAEALLHRLGKFNAVPFRILALQARSDPMAFAGLPRAAIRMLINRLRQTRGSS